MAYPLRTWHETKCHRVVRCTSPRATCSPQMRTRRPMCIGVATLLEITHTAPDHNSLYCRPAVNLVLLQRVRVRVWVSLVLRHSLHFALVLRSTAAALHSVLRPVRHLEHHLANCPNAVPRCSPSIGAKMQHLASLITTLGTNADASSACIIREQLASWLLSVLPKLRYVASTYIMLFQRATIVAST